MKVLYIASGDCKYGASKSMMSLVLALNKDYGVEPVLLTKKHNKLNEICDENGIENYSCWYCDFMSGAPYNSLLLKMAKHAAKYLLYVIGIFKQHKVLACGIDFSTIDIVHTNHNRIQVGAYISTKKKIPHVWHIREFGREDYNVVFYRPNTTRFMNRHADRFVAISDAVRKSWVNKGLDGRKMVTVYNGLEIQGYVPKKKRNDDILKLVIVGHVQESKGQLQLVKAVSALPEDIRCHVQVDIIGEGYKDYLHRMNKTIRESGLTNIHFLGYQENIPTKLSEYDVGVMCSVAEGFGRVTVEYIMAGLFVIAANSGANPEIIKKPNQGILYEQGNISNLAECIKEVYINRQKYCSAPILSQPFSMDAYISGVYSVYCDVIRGTNGH